MTLYDYYVSLFFNITAGVTQVVLLIGGILFFYHTMGWFMSGSIVAILIISRLIMLKDRVMIYELMDQDLRQQEQDDSEEDR